MRSSYIWTVVITVALGAWLASGEVIIGGQGDAATDQATGSEPAVNAKVGVAGATAETTPFRVRVQTLTASDRTAELKVRGRTEADQRVSLRAQTPGLIEEIPVRIGDHVRAGDVICRLETGSREAHVLRAKAAVEQAMLDYTASATLNEKGYAADTRVRAMKAALDAAQATLKEMELDLERTHVHAPFDGIIDNLPADPGSMLSVGEVCAEIIAGDPMLVVAQVSEREVGLLQTGMPGSARLVTGATAEGTLRYIAPSANEATRTFRIELSVPNPNWRLRDGVTSEITIPLETTQAHQFSPAILTLDDDGEIGVRTVDADNRVKFIPVKLLGGDKDSVWVSGLPDSVTVITVGQEYVKDGEQVEPVFVTADAGDRGAASR
jgi:membrane fusion protein, multidrug efflux system